MTRTEQLAAHFRYSPRRIRAALEHLRERILITELSDDLAHTNGKLHQLLADEVALSGALRRMTAGVLPEQMELFS